MKRRAFTLIEMMVAVALMAMVLAMVGGIFLSVINTREKVQESLDKDKAGYGVLATIRRDLTGVYAYALGGAAFLGEDEDDGSQPADRLHFVTTADVAQSEDGVKPRLVEVGYRVEKSQNADSQELVLYRRAGPLEGPPLRGGTYTGLYVGVHSFDIKYYDKEDEDWKDEWRLPDRLPLAVKVVLELSPDERERIAAQQEGRELQVSRYEMIVGIPAQAQPAEDQTQPQGEEGAPEGGSPPTPTGSGG